MRRPPPKGRSLAELYPAVAAEWHPRNHPLDPADVAAQSHLRVWWQCPRGPDHEWQTIIAHRTAHESGCPVCTGQRATPTTSLGARHPALAREWCRDKNGALTPDDVVPGSGKRVWWRCRRDPRHAWQAVVNQRVGGYGCPYCSGHRASPGRSLADLWPILVREWHRQKNGALRPSQLLPGSGKKVWWRCRRCDHEWESAAYTRTTAGSGCPRCARNRVTDDTCLAVVCPRLVREWHPTRNLPLRPRDVFAGGGRRIWWRCRKGHEWQTTLASRVHQSSGCPYCSGRLPSPETSFAALFPAAARQWHPKLNGDLTASAVTHGSSREVWWLCPVSKHHVWRTRVQSRSNGHGCPFCAGHRVAPDNCLAKVRPSLAAEWHPTRNGSLTPRDVTRGSTKKAWWRCRFNPHHVWQTVIALRKGCPDCDRATRRGRPPIKRPKRRRLQRL